MKYTTLGRTGLRVSKLGFGASPLGNVFGDTDAKESLRAVHCAIDNGINYFDVAPYYGRTLAEARLGQALAGKRDKVVLATKCGRYDSDSFDFSARRLRESLDESLTRLQTGYLDLWQAHDVEYANERQIVEEAIPTMREMQKLGKVRAIGISGLQLRMMRRIAEAAPVDAILTYCRYNLLIEDVDELLTPFAETRGIGLILASPLLMGVLTEGGPPRWHPASAEVKRAGARIVRFCAERGVRASDVAIGHCIAHRYGAATLVGMATAEEVLQNIRAAAQPLDAEMIEGLRRTVGSVASLPWPTGRPENQDFAEMQKLA